MQSHEGESQRETERERHVVQMLRGCFHDSLWFSLSILKWQMSVSITYKQTSGQTGWTHRETGCSVRWVSEKDSQTWPVYFCDCTLKWSNESPYSKDCAICHYCLHYNSQCQKDFKVIFLFGGSFFILQSTHTKFRFMSNSNISFLPSFITSDIQIFFLSS